MSRRTFERRFKRATGDTPLHQLHRIRVEAAKRILETENRSFDKIVNAVGYEDGSFFRKIFCQITGLNPKSYRIKWASPRHRLAKATFILQRAMYCIGDCPTSSLKRAAMAERDIATSSANDATDHVSQEDYVTQSHLDWTTYDQQFSQTGSVPATIVTAFRVPTN